MPDANSPALASIPWRIFDLDWEEKPGIDDCAHLWRSVPHRIGHAPWVDFEDKCHKCGCPRCPRPGCRDRRHHRGLHIFEDGTFDPVGGYLPEEADA